jgi:hypothetical protein
MFVLILVCSEIQPDDDPTGSTYVFVLVLYKAVFDRYLFTLYFIIQHNGMYNFKEDSTFFCAGKTEKQLKIREFSRNVV